MRSRCICGKHLGVCKVIFAAEGSLYCSVDCGVNDLRDKYGLDAGEMFKQLSEEINPHDIGIKPVNKVVDILCCRDHISFEEATAKVSEVRERLNEVNGSYESAEEIMAEELGLEMDYIMDIL